MKKRWFWGMSFVCVLLFCFVILLKIQRNNYLTALVGARNGARQVVWALTTASLEISQGTDPWALWPKSTSCIKAVSYSNSTDFFSLFLDTIHTGDVILDKTTVFNEKGLSKWTILLNASDTTFGQLPLLMAGNINATTLLDLLSKGDLAGKDKIKNIGYGLVLNNDKDIFFISSNRFSSNKRKQSSVKFGADLWPSKISYLTPTGVVTVVVRP